MGIIPLFSQGSSHDLGTVANVSVASPPRNWLQGTDTIVFLQIVYKAMPIINKDTYFILSFVSCSFTILLETRYQHDPSLRYEQEKAIVFPKALHDWTHLRLQDFRSIGEYNHEVHKISFKLCFCGKEPTDAEKIEKTLSTMLPSERLL
jgi:hypothetical protein